MRNEKLDYQLSFTLIVDTWQTKAKIFLIKIYNYDHRNGIQNPSQKRKYYNFYLCFIFQNTEEYFGAIQSPRTKSYLCKQHFKLNHNMV